MGQTMMFLYYFYSHLIVKKSGIWSSYSQEMMRNMLRELENILVKGL